MRRLTVLLAACLATLTACAGPTEPVHSATGMWKGMLGPTTVTLSLVMHPDRSVTGVGVDSTPTQVTQFPVRGRVSGSTVVLLFTPESVDSGFSGQFADATRIDGSVELPGLSTTISLQREP
jgi:hypothetical protein